MDAQELRNLQEAYLEVYGNIMEKEDSPYEKASDAALDKRYGYGRASGDKRSFGRAANRSSAAAALRALRRGERSGSGTSTEAGADAVHRGWAKTAKTSTDQTPEKKAKRAQLANTEYKDLPDDEKEKDRVSFNAVKAIYKRRIQREEYDLYDIIFSHLLDEGYADTNKAALAIMANMSEEWKQSIVEEVLDEELTGPRAERAREIMATASKGKAKALNRVLKSREGSTAPGGQPSANIKGDGSEQKLPTKRGGGGIRGRAKVTTIGGSKMDQRRGNRATRRAGEEVEDTSDEN